MADVEKTKALIRSVLMSAPEGIPLKRFTQDYQETAMERLPLLGYKNVDDLCRGLKDTIRIQDSSNSTLLFAVSHASTKHVEALIAKQKKKRPPRTVSNGYHGPRNRLSLNPRARTSTTPHFQPQQRVISYNPTFQRNFTYSKRSYESPRHTVPQPRTSNGSQRPSVFERLGAAPSAPSATPRPASPQRIVNISPVETQKPPRSHPPPPASSKNWSVPPNSPTWRHEYSQARTYPISDLSAYARPGELICVIGYFMGNRKMEDTVLESGRVLKLYALRFPIYKSTTPSLQNSIVCAFSYPNWAIKLYSSPNEINEGTWVKIYGTYDSSKPQIAVSYIQVFHDVDQQHTPVTGIETSLSGLSITKDSSQIQDGCSSASDTSVYTDSDSDTPEEDGTNDQGFNSPTISEQAEFPHASVLSLTAVPTEFSSQVKSISNLLHFYLILEDEDGVLETLTSALTKFQQSVRPGNFVIPGECKGLLCSAYNVTSSRWHRAKFLNNYPNGSSIYAVSFIDLGEDTQIPVGYIRPFHSDYLQLTAQALPCSLPLPQHIASDPRIVTLFRKLVTNIPLKTRVNKRYEDKFQVDLTTPDGKNILSEIMSAVTDNNTIPDLPTRKLSQPDHFKFNLNTDYQLVSPPAELSIPPPITPTTNPNIPPLSNYGTQALVNRQITVPSNYSFPDHAYLRTLTPPLNSVPLPGPLSNINNSHDNYLYQYNPRPNLNLGAISNTNLSNGVRPPLLRLPILQSPVLPPVLPSPVLTPLQTSFVTPLYNNGYNSETVSPLTLAPELQNLVRYETLPIASYFRAVVTCVYSPDRFYVQNCSIHGELAKLTSLLQFYGSVSKQTTVPSAPVAEFCLAYSVSKQWARVRVMSVNNARSEVLVLLLDYGTEEHVHMSNLLKLSPNHFQLPFQAIQVKLDKVKPIGTSWSDPCISRFKELTLNTVMRAYPKLPFPSILLTDATSVPNMDIHTILISEGFAAASA